MNRLEIKNYKNDSELVTLELDRWTIGNPGRLDTRHRHNLSNDSDRCCPSCGVPNCSRSAVECFN
jgi:hypothetical protein